MDTSCDRPPAVVENPPPDQTPLTRSGHRAFRVGIGLLGVILVAGLTELAWPGDNTLVALRTALFLFAGGVAVWLLGREIARLRDAEARFRSLTELSSDWYWQQDENLRFTTFSFSTPGSELAGLPAEASIGKTRWELTNIKPRSCSWVEHQAVLAARQTFRDFEYSRLLPDGSTGYLSVSGAPIFDDQGRFKGYQGVTRNITERKLAEAALRESEARFRTLTEASSDWYWRQDENLRFTYLPDGTNAGYPAPAEASLGKTRWELGNKSTPVSSSWAEHQTVLAARQPFRDFEYGRLDEDGITRYVSVSGAPIFDEEGRFKGYHGVGRNITERKLAEAALRESEARFRSLTKLSSDWYWRQDENLRYTHIWSEVENHGYTADSSIGKTRWELAGVVKLLNGTWAEHKAVLEARQPFRDLEYCRIGPDGVVRYISISGVPLFDREGRFKGYEGVGLNITERKRIEQDLRERQEILDVAQKAARAVAFEWRIGTGEGQNRWSLDLEAMYGLPPGSYDGTRDSWKKLVFPEDWPAVKAALDRAAETGEVATEYRVLHPDGRVHWLQARGRIFFDDERRPVRTVGFMLDVTERHKAELDQTRFRRFFDLPLIGMGVTSPERRFLEVNEKLCQILGYGRPELIGRDWASITHPDDVGGNLVLLDKALNGETDSYSMEKRYIHRDGHTVHASICVSCVRSSDGTPDHFVLTVEDVTERHRAEEQRVKLEHQLRQAQRMEAMGTLAGGIAHDFNNILGAILGYSEMALRDAPKESRLRRDLDSIMTAGERGRALVERILAFSRSSVNERVAVHVERVAREALDQLSANLPANITVAPRLRAGRAAVLGDATQVHQVLMNLATNAIQAMPSGGTLRVSLERVHVDAARVAMVGTLDAGDYVVLEVADGGIGIAPDTLARIFDPFFTTKEVGVGTGLGLSLVHGIVTELKGAIDVTSAVGQGSVFTAYLPDAGDAEDDREHAEPEAPRGNRQQVLIVDDEAPLVGLARETLEELGYVPVAFTSSVAALEAFRAKPGRFDAVITDERMPGMSGSALIREIRGIRRSIPILLVSGYVGGGVTRRALESGADEVLKKPLSARQLAASLARVLHG